MDRTDRRIVALAVPALGSLAVEPMYVLVDTAIVGRLGTPQLGGLAIAATVLSLVVAACNFLTYGTTERVARRLGAGRRAEAADVAVQTMWLSCIVGVAIAPLVALMAPVAATWLGASGEVRDVAVTYLRIGALSLPFVVLALGAQGVQRGAADYRTPLVILLAANLVNVVLEVTFVFGFDWGVPGSAWSTVIAQVGAGVAFAVVVRHHLAAATRRRPARAGMSPLLSAGRHLLLRVGSMLAVTAGATALAARVDGPTLAAHQIAVSMLLLMSLVFDALAIPAQTLVAEQLGHGDVTSAPPSELAHRCVRLAVIVGVAATILLAVSAPGLVRLFSGDAAVVSRATAALLWLAAMLVPAAVAMAYDGVLIGAGDYRFLGLAALGYLAVLAPVGAVVLVTGGGIAAIWAAIGMWMVLRAVTNHLRSSRVLGRPAVALDPSGAW